MSLLNSKIFTGNANPALAQKVSSLLDTTLDQALVSKFSDGEIRVEIQTNVRGHGVFVLQSTCAPSDTNIMELLIMIDALRRSSAKDIIAVIPYFGYSRQDRRPDYTRTPITSRLVASMLEAAGATQVVTIDLHSGQQQGFFNIPVVNISASSEFIRDIKKINNTNNKRLVVVSPDVGGVARARYIAKRLDNADLAIVDKRRDKANESKVMHVIGDVKDAHCVIIDDMIDTAGTLKGAAAALKENGADSVCAYGTHPVLSGHAYSNILNSKLDQVVVTDTIPLDTTQHAKHCIHTNRIRVISVAGLLADTIERIQTNQSVSAIYE